MRKPKPTDEEKIVIDAHKETQAIIRRLLRMTDRQRRRVLRTVQAFLEGA